jgi:hypothetical protein
MNLPTSAEIAELRLRQRMCVHPRWKYIGDNIYAKGKSTSEYKCDLCGRTKEVEQ